MTIHAQSWYVATDLSVTDSVVYGVTTAVTLQNGIQEEDTIIAGKLYRRLSPTYFAWLRHKMADARARYGRKQLPASRWEVMRERFNAVQDLAVEQLGESALMQAIESMTDDILASYQPPTVQRQAGDIASCSVDQSVSRQAYRRPTADEIYAKPAGQTVAADYHVIWTMMDTGTWNPPLPEIADLFVVATTLAMEL
ncbi:MAG TPA: hypothetical protein VGL77_18220 [Armatimonadota bacterium]